MLEPYAWKLARTVLRGEKGSNPLYLPDKLPQIIFPGRYLSIEPLAKAIKDKRFSLHYTGNHQHLEYLSTKFCVSEAKTYQQMTFNIITKLPINKEKL